MCKILCPLCERRLCEMTAGPVKKETYVTVEMKCPHCKKIVKVVFHVHSIVKNK
ncbi:MULTISPECIES: hypothetical protein [Robinsoniella]|uniref:Mu-like prophage protein Com n=1 Tax=Robinsoniella peoriensis TaxID=180332 RepID=A0A4U8QBT5_9FIRM|nr:MULTISPECIES: hypothetical protein [Robinsoniella]MDU7031064.1 hypothetical protein [Clostridiales bacterium]TLD02139.1 hypothetical protein DSM106044_00945 [Robinsoniella peoriensis]